MGLDRLDAQLLLSHVVGQPHAWLLAHDTDPLQNLLHKRYEDLCRRRAQGEPAAYLLGQQGFFGLSLSVNADVLVPRPDTEVLVNWALDTLGRRPFHAPPARVLDLGTGSGAIALAIKHQCPMVSVTAVDASEPALRVARHNAEQLGLDITFLHGSWFSPLVGQRFDLIVSNPPYIAEGDPHLPALRFEPDQALSSGADGLDDIRQIAAQAGAHLAPGGALLLEHGYDQAVAVKHVLIQNNFNDVSTRFDFGGQERCTGGETSKG